MVFLFKSTGKKDSLYYKIEEFSDRKSYQILPSSHIPKEADSTSVKSRTEKLSQETYNKKYIRNIIIETMIPSDMAQKTIKKN